MWLQDVAVEDNPGSSHSCGCSQTYNTSTHTHIKSYQRRKHPRLPFSQKIDFSALSKQFVTSFGLILSSVCGTADHTVMLRHRCHQVGCLICEVVSGRWFLSGRNDFPVEYGCLSILSALFTLTECSSNAVTDLGDTNLGDWRKGERQGLKCWGLGGVTVPNIWERQSQCDADRTQDCRRSIRGGSRKEDKNQEKKSKKNQRKKLSIVKSL